MKIITFLSLFVILALTIIQNSYAAVAGANQAAAVLCDVVMFVRGRFGRAIALLMMLTIGTSFLLGSLNWKQVLTVSVGIALLFGAESVAYMVLPSTIKGISGVSPNGAIYNMTDEYTPEEIVSQVCPELSNFGQLPTAKVPNF